MALIVAMLALVAGIAAARARADEPAAPAAILVTPELPEILAAPCGEGGGLMPEPAHR